MMHIKHKEWFRTLAFLLALFTAGCVLVTPVAHPTPTAQPTSTSGRCGFGGCGSSFQAKLTEQAPTLQYEGTCSDGICQQAENALTCPQDCLLTDGCSRKGR